MRKRDKLDRWRTQLTAYLSEKMGVPFWITLTPRERTRWTANEVETFYRRTAQGRREFRNFVRALCA